LTSRGGQGAERRHRFHVVQATIAALGADGKMTAKDVARAIKLHKIDAEKPNPLHA